MRGTSWLSALAVSVFISAGSLKDTAVLAWLPVDLTLASAAVVMALVGWKALTDVPDQTRAVMTGFLILGVALLWTSAGGYETQKTTRLFTLTFLAVLAPVVLARSTTDVLRFLVASTALSGIAVAAVVIHPQHTATYAGSTVAALGDNTISVASGAGFVALVLAVAVLWKRLPWAVGLPLIGVAIYAMFQTGSRGPLVATAVALCLTVIVPRARPPAIRAVGVLCLVGVGAVKLFAFAPAASRGRSLALLAGSRTGDVGTRLDLFHRAAASIWNHPMGLGWGGYERIAPARYHYPHDLPLEVLAEGGTVVGGLFLLWLALHYLRIRKLEAGFVGSAVFACVTAAFLEALVSGDLNDNKRLFFSLGLGMALVGASPVAARTHSPMPQATVRLGRGSD